MYNNFNCINFRNNVLETIVFKMSHVLVVTSVIFHTADVDIIEKVNVSRLMRCVCVFIKDIHLYHVESVILVNSSGALMNFITQQRYKFLNYKVSLMFLYSVCSLLTERLLIINNN